jgi:hypothetical protein
MADGVDGIATWDLDAAILSVITGGMYIATTK